MTQSNFPKLKAGRKPLFGSELNVFKVRQLTRAVVLFSCIRKKCSHCSSNEKGHERHFVKPSLIFLHFCSISSFRLQNCMLTDYERSWSVICKRCVFALCISISLGKSWCYSQDLYPPLPQFFTNCDNGC